LEAINTAVSDRNFEIDPYRISNIEQVTRHDVVAFLRHLEEGIGTPARWLHFGLTSSDVVDTAFAMTLLEACSLIDTRMENLISTLKARIIEHAHTPMVGRTHGQHAEPTTFGLVLAGHYQEVHRAKKRVLLACEDIVGTISGAVGTYAHLSPELEDKILSSLGLKAEVIPTQVVSRDRHANLFCAFGLTAAALERLAVTVRHLQRTEVGEVREGFREGQTGSSAMPHKRNPILSENLCGLARIVCGAIDPAIRNVALWNERDISHSSVERYIAPDVTATLAHMIDKATDLIKNLEINVERMKENLLLTGGLIFSESVMLALVKSGMEKKRAYEIVQRNAMYHSTIPFEDTIGFDSDVIATLGFYGLKKCFDLEHALRHTDTLINRALGI
jgi:adenylosuccinate lyase